jgi:D-3-phosphoglycerate dehydrogenase
MILEITNQAMSGEISFPVALEKRLKVLSLNKDDIRKATDDISNMVSDSFIKNKEFIASNSDSIWIVSGGFKEVITPIVREFGIAENHILANSFIYSKNQVIGCDRNNNLFKNKGKIKAINNLNLDNDIIIMGDGFTDYEVYSEGVAKAFICYIENITRKSIVEKSSYTASSFNEAIDILNQF